MNVDILLLDSLLCFLFVFVNFQINRKKIALLPSTLFGISWGVSTLGCYLYSVGYIDLYDGAERYYKNSPVLQEIGEYQFYILCVIFAAFFTAQIRNTKKCTIISNNYSFTADLQSFKSILKYFFYVYSLVGFVRLFVVLQLVGFDYSAIRYLYLTGRSSFSNVDLQFIRIASYLMRLSIFYIAIEGIQSAHKGLNLKRVSILFVLFCPFQLSFGGRLVILSFFLPFIISYFIVFALNGMKFARRSDKKQIILLVVVTLFLVIGLQILKQGKSISWSTIEEYSNDLFYNSSSYIYMGEFWKYISDGFDLQLGRVLLTGTCPLINQMMEYWIESNNSASVCVPSMIPGMYLDFGFIGSLVVYFVIFYIVERFSLSKINKLSVFNILIYLTLCIFCFNSVGSSMYDCFKALIINIFLITLINLLRKV